ADVAGFRAGFSHSGSGGPPDGEGKAHLKALGGAAFGAVHNDASSMKIECSLARGPGTIELGIQNGLRPARYGRTRRLLAKWPRRLGESERPIEERLYVIDCIERFHVGTPRRGVFRKNGF